MNFSDIDWFEFFTPIIIVFGLLFAFIYFRKLSDNNFKLKAEIIKQSEEYTIFKECTEIDKKYYCK